jgi:hypothetical protein
MRFSAWMRSTAAAVGAVVIVAMGAAPTMAATAQQSIVPIGALDGQWLSLGGTTDASQRLDNYSVTFGSGADGTGGVIAVVGLIVLPSADMAQSVVQSITDSSKSKNPGMSIVPSQTYGDANGVEMTQADSGMVMQGRVFVDKGTVVYVVAVGPTAQSDLIKNSADSLAYAQDNILPSNY